MKIQLLFLLLLQIVSNSAFAASLAGDIIDTRWQYNTFDASASYLVGSGVEDTSWISNAYSIDISENRISIDANSGYLGQGKNTIWTFSSLDFGEPITSVALDTNWSNMNDSWVTFGPDSITLTFLMDANYGPSVDFLYLTLNPGSGYTPIASAPVPAAVWFLATAMAGLLAFTRQKRQS